MARRKDRDGIRQLGPKRFQVVLDLGRDADGIRHREYKTVHGSYEEAKAVRAQLVVDKTRGEFVRRSDLSLADYLRDWLAWKEPFVDERTWNAYDAHLGSVIEKLGAKKLQELTPQDLDTYYAWCLMNERGQKPGSLISPTTVRHRHNTLNTALDRAVEIGSLVKNPAGLAHPPRRARPQMFVLDETQCGQLLAATDDATDDDAIHGLIARLALMSGAREGEILGLGWPDMDFAAGGMNVRHPLAEHRRKTSSGTWYYLKETPKNGKMRFVALDADTLARLNAHRMEQLEQRRKVGAAYNTELDLVFATPLGEPLRTSAVYRRFKRLASSLGFEKMRVHDCRHTHITLLLKAGVPPHVVSERVGHSSVAFTLDRYGWVLPGQQAQAAASFAAAVLVPATTPVAAAGQAGSQQPENLPSPGLAPSKSFHGWSVRPQWRQDGDSTPCTP